MDALIHQAVEAYGSSLLITSVFSAKKEAGGSAVREVSGGKSRKCDEKRREGSRQLGGEEGDRSRSGW